MKIAIVGAGLSGLTAAACFARAGHDVVVFERQGGLSPQGGIIGLRAGALRILYDMGLQAEIEAVSVELGESQMNVLSTGAVMKNIALHNAQAANEGLTRVTTRPALARILYDAASKEAAIIKFNMTTMNFDEDSSRVTLRFNDGSTYAADLVLAAEGIRSKMRSKILQDVEPSLYEPIVTNTTFYVCHLPADRVPSELRERLFKSNGPWMRMTAWVGQDTYALSAYDKTSDIFNLGFTIIEPTDQSSLWDENGDIAYVRDHFETLACHDLRAALSVADGCDRWRSAYMPNLPRWTSDKSKQQGGGRVALLGDAAHAIVHSGGAGISISIEDIAALNYLIDPQNTKFGKELADVPEILQLWERACRPRIDRVREYSLFHTRRRQGDKSAIADSEKAGGEDASNGEATAPNMDAHPSTLSFARWLSAYDPIAAVDSCFRLGKREE